MKKLFKPIVLLSKAEIIEPDTSQFKAIAGSFKAKYGFDLKSQVDLMYVRSCLVTSGINDNDDIFLSDEMWNARHTPMLKPANWQHKDKDILGVVYSVEARKLNGDVIDFNQKEPPKEPYELWTEAAVYKLIHEDKAEEIKARAAKGNLFVSMEAWFDDYNYGFVDNNRDISKVIARTSDTAFLDMHLKANGGSGKYDNQRFGRALKGFTFGGYGFVDVPANKRSEIDSVLDMSEDNSESVSFAENEESEDYNQQLLKSLFSAAQEKEDMEKVTASDGTVDVSKVADTVISKLESQKAARKAEKDAKRIALKAEKRKLKIERLKVEASELKNAVDTKAAALETEVKSRDAKAAKLTDVLSRASAALDVLIKEVAGATNDTPPEIKAIDAAIAEDTGDAVFNAKIAWIKKSMGSLAEKAKDAEGLREEIAEAGAALREQEIRALCNGTFTEKETEVLVKAGLAKVDAAYEEWLAEKKFLVARIKTDAAKKKAPKKGAKLPPGAGSQSDDDEEDDGDEDDNAKASKDLSESFSSLINGVEDGNVSDLNSGVNAGRLRSPKDKIAGSILDGAEPVDQPDLSAANGGEGEGEEDNIFKTLASELTSGNKNDKKTKPVKAQAGFDPVEE